MSMKYAVLGLLVERRGYAYDIARRFEDTVGPAFHVHYGAIYQALDALERDALIRGALREHDELSERRRRTGPRVVYETTDEGIDAYEQWIPTPARVEPLRGELALKVALSRPEHGTGAAEPDRRLRARLPRAAQGARRDRAGHGGGRHRLVAAVVLGDRARARDASAQRRDRVDPRPAPLDRGHGSKRRELTPWPCSSSNVCASGTCVASVR